MDFNEIARAAAKKEYFAAYVLLGFTAAWAVAYLEFEQFDCAQAKDVVNLSRYCFAQKMPVNIQCYNFSHVVEGPEFLFWENGSVGGLT
jgi:hypothetical protein